MKAKNVSKNIGKEVVFKVPLEEVTNCDGCYLWNLEHEQLSKAPLRLGSDEIDSQGDVSVINSDGDGNWVHHKFIKLAHKEYNND